MTINSIKRACWLLLGLELLLFSAPSWGLAAAEVAKLLPSVGAAGDNFGHQVAVSGDTAVVGVPYDDLLGPDAGAAYVFVRSGTGWIEQARLVAEDGADFDHFGWSVAILNDTLLVGATTFGGYSGSVYVFVRSGATWSQQAKLLPSDGTAGDSFGFSVAIAGDTVLVGAYWNTELGYGAGAAYVFVRSGTTWSEQAKLLAGDGEPYDFFGWSVDIAGDTALIGAWGDDDYGEHAGSAYVFTRAGSTWTQQAKIRASDGGELHHFGRSVALDGDTAVIGARGDGDFTGSAYVFVRSGTTWVRQSKLRAQDGLAFASFGYSVAVQDNTAIIGAPEARHVDGRRTGAVHVFSRSDNLWVEEGKLLASDGAEYDWFGSSVATSGKTVVIGAPVDDDNGLSSGSSYVFVLSTVSFEGLRNLVNDLVSDGSVDARMRNSLFKKVLNAEASAAKGKVCTAVNKLGAFINQAEAQTGKKIDAAAAAQLIGYAENLIEQLPDEQSPGASCR